jgi:hypothetical protein
VLVAAAAIAWIWGTVPVAAVREALAAVRPSVVLGVVMTWALGYVVVEVLSFGLVWRRHLAPSLAWRDAATLVCGKMILSPLLPGLTKAVPVMAFWRKYRVPATRVLGAGELIGAAEVTVLTVLATVALLAGDVRLGPGPLSALACYWAAIPLVVAMRRVPRFSQLERWGLLAPWVGTRLPDALGLLALRWALAVLSIACVHFVLVELGVRLAPSATLAFGSLLLFSSCCLPVSVGGYGGPQALATLLLANTWGVCSPAQAVGASLVWATAVLSVQVAVGSLALPRLFWLLRENEAWHG